MDSNKFQNLNDIQNRIRNNKDNKEPNLLLSWKDLVNVPSEVFELTHLEQLTLSNNSLTSLPSEISKLKNLKRLFLLRNHLTSLPPEILELEKLTELYLTGNELKEIPPEILKLKTLTRLHLAGNKLEKLPDEISNLENLIQLDLSGNQLKSLPNGISKLKHLRILDLRGNKLASLPREILELEIAINLGAVVPTGIFIGDNPIVDPPLEIVKAGKKAIFDYYKSFESGMKKLNEVKVLFVGEGGAGKTSLVKCLIGEKIDENEPQTHGINIMPWEMGKGNQKIKVNFWDFGGQEIYHATHQFFLSKRSLYILVLNSREENRTEEYWLKHIRSFGGESPVLVVVNKIDENQFFDLNKKFLEEKYSSIKGFYRVSCKRGLGIDNFKEGLERELAKVKHIQIKWAKNWFIIKTELEKMNKEYISYDEYKDLCERHNINGSSQDTLLGFLNDLGVVVHFDDYSLLDTYILEPKWITEAVYKIIDSTELIESDGILKISCLRSILVGFPTNKYSFIINVMKKFELCYEIDEGTILLPQHLKIQEPNFDFNYETSLKAFIEYDFLPKSVMPRFIVKMHKDIKDDLRWRTGVVLNDKEFNSFAVVKLDYEAKIINIYVNGNKQRRDYFSVVLFNLKEINKSFKEIGFIVRIPLPDNPKLSVSYNHLIRLEERGILYIFPDGADHEYSVKELLGKTSEDVNKIEIIKDLLKIVKKIADESDTSENLSEKIRSIVSLNPNYIGMEDEIVNKIQDIILTSKKIVELYPGKSLPEEMLEFIKLNPNFYGLEVDIVELIKFFKRRWSKKIEYPDN
ncbi:MAG: COR domain-containing protein [Methanosarcina sp.]